MDVDIWSLLLTDLLADIFRRLDASDLILCACVCKPWRRAIIGNASRLRPRPDRFNPNLLLGFFHEYWHKGGVDDVRLQLVRGPFESALTAATADGGDDEPGFCEKPCSFIPATSAGGVDLSSYNRILSSRDGFLLLFRDGNDLCLCNPLTGYCAFLPVVEFWADYVLITSYDDLHPLGDDDLGGARIVAMAGETTVHGLVTTVTYQLSFAITGGAAAYTWGPVKRSLELKKRLREHAVFSGTEVIYRGTIYWLGELIDGNTCVLAVDVRTGWTWTIEVPAQRLHRHCGDVVLATSMDGWITMVRTIPSWGEKTIHVWVLVDGDRWTLRQKILVPNLKWLNEAFCPRSGWLLAWSCKQGQEFLVDVERGTSRPISYRYAGGL